jgi:hypothetical protein
MLVVGGHHPLLPFLVMLGGGTFCCCRGRCGRRAAAAAAAVAAGLAWCAAAVVLPTYSSSQALFAEDFSVPQFRQFIKFYINNKPFLPSRHSLFTVRVLNGPSSLGRRFPWRAVVVHAVWKRFVGSPDTHFLADGKVGVVGFTNLRVSAMLAVAAHCAGLNDATLRQLFFRYGVALAVVVVAADWQLHAGCVVCCHVS